MPAPNPAASTIPGRRLAQYKPQQIGTMGKMLYFNIIQQHSEEDCNNVLNVVQGGLHLTTLKEFLQFLNVVQGGLH
eukprot:scaffold360335_cov156-Cyclotella_meneghiniana.AAC.2